MNDVPAFVFSTCICTNFNFLKTFFLIFELLPHCILIKGNYLQGHLWETMLGSIFAIEGYRICSFWDGLPRIS